MLQYLHFIDEKTEANLVKSFLPKSHKLQIVQKDFKSNSKSPDSLLVHHAAPARDLPQTPQKTYPEGEKKKYPYAVK